MYRETTDFQTGFEWTVTFPLMTILSTISVKISRHSVSSGAVPSRPSAIAMLVCVRTYNVWQCCYLRVRRLELA